jgi:hypothetical protein
MTIEVYNPINHTIRNLEVSTDDIEKAYIDPEKPTVLNVIYVNGYMDSYTQINRETAQGIARRINEATLVTA